MFFLRNPSQVDTLPPRKHPSMCNLASIFRLSCSRKKNKLGQVLKGELGPCFPKKLGSTSSINTSRHPCATWPQIFELFIHHATFSPTFSSTMQFSPNFPFSHKFSAMVHFFPFLFIIHFFINYITFETKFFNFSFIVQPSKFSKAFHTC